MLTRVRSIVAHRRILTLLIGRDLKIKFSNTVLGYFWTVLEPLLMVGVYWFVFTKIFTRTVGQQPYVLFLVLGLLPWYWASSVINESSRAFNRDARLVRSSNLTREIWILRVVGSKAAEFVLAWPVALLFVVIYWGEVRPSAYIWAWPLAMLLQVVLLIGVGLILSPLAVLYKDIKRLMRVFTRILLYMSPVIYGVADIQQADAIPEWIQRIYVLNPLSGIFDLYRAAFFPDFFAGWAEVGVAAAVSFGLFGVGILVFRRLEGAVLKEV